jgi:hypothetical protein
VTDELIQRLAPLARTVSTLDLAAPDAASALAAAFDAEVMAPITAALRAAHAAGLLTPHRASPTLTYGRLAKATETTHGQSIDVVDIAGEGAVHSHPRGEVSWCIPLEGEPVFEQAREGWVVLPPGSRHVPTVTGGRMLIVYFLPGGEVAWG